MIVFTQILISRTYNISKLIDWFGSNCIILSRALGELKLMLLDIKYNSMLIRLNVIYGWNIFYWINLCKRVNILD